LKTNRNRMLKTAFFLKRQLTAAKGKLDLNTQEIRRELIIDLLFLKEYADRRAKDRRLTRKNQMGWMHVAGEISRTINYIARDFDAVEIKARLEALEKLLASEDEP